MAKKKSHKIVLSNKTRDKLLELDSLISQYSKNQQIILETVIDEKGNGSDYILNTERTKLFSKET